MLTGSASTTSGSSFFTSKRTCPRTRIAGDRAEVEGHDHEGAALAGGDDLRAAREVDRDRVATVLRTARRRGARRGAVEAAARRAAAASGRADRAAVVVAPLGLVGIERDLHAAEDRVALREAGAATTTRRRSPAPPERSGVPRPESMRAPGTGRTGKSSGWRSARSRDSRPRARARGRSARARRERTRGGRTGTRPQASRMRTHVHHAVVGPVGVAGAHEVEDAVAGRIDAGEHARPGHGRLRAGSRDAAAGARPPRRAGRNSASRRSPSGRRRVLVEVAGQPPEVHAVEAEDDGARVRVGVGGGRGSAGRERRAGRAPRRARTAITGHEEDADAQVRERVTSGPAGPRRLLRGRATGAPLLHGLRRSLRRAQGVREHLVDVVDEVERELAADLVRDLVEVDLVALRAGSRASRRRAPPRGPCRGCRRRAAPDPAGVISPVVAVSLRARRPVTALVSATKIATPALGPSFGTAPAGTWMWMSIASRSWVTSPCPRR